VLERWAGGAFAGSVARQSARIPSRIFTFPYRKYAINKSRIPNERTIVLEKFTYLSSQNVGYIEDLFQTFLQNPQAIDPDWRMFFEGVEFAKKIGGGAAAYSLKELKVYDLIRAYRAFGHLQAKLDPLDLQQRSFPELELRAHGLDEKDLAATFEVGSVVGLKGARLKEIVERLQKIYCGTLTVDYADCYPEVQKWVQKEFEQTGYQLGAEEKKQTLSCLVKTETLERFIHTRFVGAKRFSVEGGDVLLPMMEHLVRLGGAQGMSEVVVGMAHRGRVNMLATFCGKPLDLIFSEFEGAYNPNQGYVADGDVKYHMGFSADRELPNGQKVHLSMAYNPSHLEAVNPVVCGMARAKQRLRKDNKERKRVVPVLVHGDAAFIGQGVVAETLQLSLLEGYGVGGTVHVVINNQVGFTTSPEYSRSSTYCTDIAKALHVPVFHVNGDDTEACLRAMDLAYRFRQTFRQDVVIDVVCYRRYGHNEGDEPGYTQPLMYNVIKGHPTVREIYAKQLAAEGLVTETQVQAEIDAEMNRMGELLEKARKESVTPKFFTLDGAWKGLRRAATQDLWVKTETGVEESVLQKVGATLTSYPDGFAPHPKLQKLLETRKKMMDSREVDWGMAELLSYGSLVTEGIPVRISGQDAGRGTFTHRHAIFHDVNNGSRHSPLNTIQPDVADFAVHDSALSEYGVLGFEYGNSITDPRMLTIWEGQFGDFANGAQIIIDQFIASAESKWQRMSGLTMLLPHGFEGQGPEHSSARLERFLQLCAQDNLQVAYPTTPAQIFHLLRRQVKRDFRKPLVIMSPKSLLRHPKVVSSLDELNKGGFREVIGDAAATKDAAKVKKVILCSGKIYYEILDEREKNANDGSVAILRVEQLYPFPAEQISREVKHFTNLKHILWAQEEPKNMGAYSFVAPRLQEAFGELAAKGVAFRYVGRTERASPAIGSPKVHQQEQSEIIKGCFK
jgi:2-oxoglutarate dehydrogenase E1 component